MAKLEGEATPKALVSGRLTEANPFTAVDTSPTYATMPPSGAFAQPVVSSSSLPPQYLPGARFEAPAPSRPSQLWNVVRENYAPSNMPMSSGSPTYAGIPAAPVFQPLPMLSAPRDETTIEGFATQETVATLEMAPIYNPPTPPQGLSSKDLSSTLDPRARDSSIASPRDRSNEPPRSRQMWNVVRSNYAPPASSGPPTAAKATPFASAKRAPSPDAVRVSKSRDPTPSPRHKPSRTRSSSPDLDKKKKEKSEDEEEEDKTKLIKDIQARDREIAELLQEVRARQQEKSKNVDELGKRVDALEAKLLSGSLEPKKPSKHASHPDAPRPAEDSNTSAFDKNHPGFKKQSLPGHWSGEHHDWGNQEDDLPLHLQVPPDLPPGSRVAGWEVDRHNNYLKQNGNQGGKAKNKQAQGRVVDSIAPLAPSPYIPVGPLAHLSREYPEDTALQGLGHMYPTTRPPHQVMGNQQAIGVHPVSWKDYLDMHEIGVFASQYQLKDPKTNIYEDVHWRERPVLPHERQYRPNEKPRGVDPLAPVAPVLRKFFPA